MNNIIDRAHLIDILCHCKDKYAKFSKENLNMDMSRGKPSKEQLDLSLRLLDILTADDIYSSDGSDIRNYGILDGLSECKNLFSQLLDINENNIFIGGNSSLNLMYDTISRAFNFGILGSTPWSRLEKVKFLCPSPGYDRHFSICETFNIEMIPIDMTVDGPDMDKIELLIENDDSIKGIWCVPVYSNPQGIEYSDQTILRLSKLNPKASDFRIFWDNAYLVHHLSFPYSKRLNIFDECFNNNNLDLIYIFCSTSKITFSGSGVAAIACHEANMKEIKKYCSVQTIGFDKINQLRHSKFFNSSYTIDMHMKKHADLIKPKFKVVLDILDREILNLNIARWTNPNGGYFISLDTINGCAKRTIDLCKKLGVKFTEAGATYPYKKDPNDSNIRIAPTYPSLEELTKSMEVFCTCLKISAIEKIL